MSSVYIIDDNQRFTYLLSNVFKATGAFEVCDVFCDAFSALTQFRKAEPDIAVIDMLMPGMDGAELLTKLREDKLARHTKLIALSPIVNDEIVRMAQNLGVTYFIATPMSPELIVKRVLDISGIASSVTLPSEGTNKRRNVSLEEIVFNYLHALGIPAHYKGYAYLKCAI